MATCTKMDRGEEDSDFEEDIQPQPRRISHRRVVMEITSDETDCIIIDKKMATIPKNVNCWTDHFLPYLHKRRIQAPVLIVAPPALQFDVRVLRDVDTSLINYSILGLHPKEISNVLMAGGDRGELIAKYHVMRSNVKRIIALSDALNFRTNNDKVAWTTFIQAYQQRIKRFLDYVLEVLHTGIHKQAETAKVNSWDVIGMARTILQLYNVIGIGGMIGFDRSDAILDKKGQTVSTLVLKPPSIVVLLHGPPGVGKTMVIDAIVTKLNETNVNVLLHATPASALLSKFFGGTAKSIIKFFQDAENAAVEQENKDPTKKCMSVVFLDEVEILAMNRTQSDVQIDEQSGQATDALLTCFGGLYEHCIIICATNCPAKLDDALRRRFTDMIMVDLPITTSRETKLQLWLYKTLLPVSGSTIARNMKTWLTTDPDSVLPHDILQLEQLRLFAQPQWSPIPTSYRNELQSILNMIQVPIALDMAFGPPLTVEYMHSDLLPLMDRKTVSVQALRNYLGNKSAKRDEYFDMEMRLLQREGLYSTRMLHLRREEICNKSITLDDVACSIDFRSCVSLGYTLSDLQHVLNKVYHSALQRMLALPVPLSALVQWGVYSNVDAGIYQTHLQMYQEVARDYGWPETHAFVFIAPSIELWKGTIDMMRSEHVPWSKLMPFVRKLLVKLTPLQYKRILTPYITTRDMETALKNVKPSSDQKSYQQCLLFERNPTEAVANLRKK